MLSLLSCHRYAQNRQIPTGKNESVALSDLPVMRDTIARIQSRWHELSAFVEKLEKVKLGKRFLSLFWLMFVCRKLFSTQKEIDEKLVDQIACAKIECIRFSLESFFDIKSKVGSFSVQEDSPFSTEKNLEASLYCQRFAEGDAAVLEQKMARDHIKHYAKAPWLILSDLFLKTPLTVLKYRRNAALEVKLAISKVRFQQSFVLLN